MLKPNRYWLKATTEWWREKARSELRIGITLTLPTTGLSNFMRRGANRRKRPSGEQQSRTLQFWLNNSSRRITT